MSAAQTVEAIVPELRFSAFGEHWKKSELKDIASIQRGRFSPRPRNNPIYYGGEIPFVQTSDVVNSVGRIQSFTQTLNEKGLEVSKLFPKGTILITIAANIGYTGVLQVDMACPDSLVGISCNPEVHNYFLDYLLQKEQPRMDYLAVEAAQKNINIGFLEIYVLTLPSLPEQRKIADFLTAVDKRIEKLIQKKALLEDYKKGVMQQLFTQTIRFKDDDGKDFPDWEEKKLSEVLYEHKEKSDGTESVFSVSVHKGLIDQVEHLGRSFSAASTNHYNRVNPDDVVYTKSPTGDFPLGIIKQSHTSKSVIVSPLYGVFKPESPGLGRLLEVYFESPCNVHNYLHSLIQKGAKNTFSINNSTFLSKSLSLPISEDEQKKIGAFFSTIDRKIEGVATQITETQTFKKGLLQQMFV